MNEVDLYDSRYFTTSSVPSRAIRQFHSEILEKAKDALCRQPVDKREFISAMIAADRIGFPEIKHRVEQFWKLIQEFGKGPEERSVLFVSSVLWNNRETFVMRTHISLAVIFLITGCSGSVDEAVRLLPPVRQLRQRLRRLLYRDLAETSLVMGVIFWKCYLSKEECMQPVWF